MFAFKRRLKILLNTRSRALLLDRVKAGAIIRWRNFADPHGKKIVVGRRVIGPGHPVFIIAEIGINHNGSLERAKQLIDLAAAAGADAVKFQKRELSATYKKSVVENPERHEQPFQYLIPLLKEFELGEPEYHELFDYATAKGIIPFASAFDEPSVDFLSRFKPTLYKVASADLTNFPLLERLIREKVPLILSTGMSTLDEVDETMAWLLWRRAKCLLLHCQSTYPAPPDTLNLAMIKELSRRYEVPVGYSGHELGIHQTIAALALGAVAVERHITLDKTLPGPDHASSLGPDEFKELVKNIREYEIALGVPVRRISRGEVANRLTLRKSLVAAREIKRGQMITRDMLTAKGPGTGLSPQRLYDLVGRRAKRDMAEDDMFTERDIYPVAAAVESLPRFSSKWGLKARFFELAKLSNFQPQPRLFEFHLSEDDLDFPFDTSQKYPQELYLHAPEYFGREAVDLAAAENELWEKSIAIIQRTIDKARVISRCFSGTPKIIIHVGGMSIGSPLADRERLLGRAEQAFRRLDTSGVDILPENLPPFGWFFSGLWHCNIFGAAEEMVSFCNRLGYRMCLDLSHAWLYCQKNSVDYLNYLKTVSPYVAHLHIADGRGEHKEGLQINEGDIPFLAAFRVLEENIPSREDVSWVPEIWQGHLHDYLQFRLALTHLAKFHFLSEAGSTLT